MVITPSGCHSVTEGLTFLEGDFSAPQISSFTLTGSASAEINFSKEISEVNACIFRKHNPERMNQENNSNSENKIPKRKSFNSEQTKTEKVKKDKK